MAGWKARPTEGRGAAELRPHAKETTEMADASAEARDVLGERTETLKLRSGDIKLKPLTLGDLIRDVERPLGGIIGGSVEAYSQELWACAKKARFTGTVEELWDLVGADELLLVRSALGKLYPPKEEDEGQDPTPPGDGAASSGG
jgi:hypothetical protein